MLDANTMRVADLQEKYQALVAANAYERLYNEDPRFDHMFAVLHDRINRHFHDINDRAKSTGHYWADNSRALLDLIEEVRRDLHELALAGVKVSLTKTYETALEDAETWLSRSGGSSVPPDYRPIDILRYDPIFTLNESTVRLKKESTPIELKMVGSGSYAHVFSYTDPDYGVRFAIKRAKNDIGERDGQRFRQEFEVMKKLDFPYVVQVFQFDDERREYKMEFCDETLRRYISSRNNQLSFASRKRIALQFLYGLNYIHSKGLLHRDVSLQNVLVKIYDSDAVIVKLSDFGLVKDKASEFTRTHTEMRGTIRDPMLHDFKSYDLVNEMYAVGFVLSYIFSGRESLLSGVEGPAPIVQKCAAHDTTQRYQSILDVIADVEKLQASPATDSTDA